MGNTSSVPAANQRRLDSPSRPLPHRSLRTKKKSLELPDLASLSLTPAQSPSPLRRGTQTAQISSPIPIPATPDPTQGAGYHDPATLYPAQRHLNQLTSDDLVAAMPDVLVQHPSTHTHIPIYPPNQRPKGGNPYYRNSLPYNSTRSFSSRGYPYSNNAGPPQSTSNSTAAHSRVASFQVLPTHPEFVHDTVYSTIPVALPKAEEERALLQDHLSLDADFSAPADNRKNSIDDPLDVKITWRGGGNNVVLIRAGDDNWKGKQSMDHQPDGTFTTTIPLPRGTHHLKFIVDNTERIADDLPTAVADDGTLANYVSPGLNPRRRCTPPTSPLPSYLPHTTPKPDSFFLDNDSDGNSRTKRKRSPSDGRKSGRDKDEDEVWTQSFPPALLAAAQLEESYLAMTIDNPSPSPSALTHASTHTPAPNIPPAPILPRFLDKLILNNRPGYGREVSGYGHAGGSSGIGSSMGDVRKEQRDRERERKGRGRSRSGTGAGTGITNITSSGGTGNAGLSANGDGIPVTTASGTDVTPTGKEREKENPNINLDGVGLADDASVLPVPSHVVLHHLSTSAIKNGVLAVGTTVRYRKKHPMSASLLMDPRLFRGVQYLTTIYYKPIS